MDDESSQLIDVSQLRRGLFVQLDLGWMDHPFPKGSFKIFSDEQIRTIRGLGLARVRYFPARSDLPEQAALSPADDGPGPALVAAAPAGHLQPGEAEALAGRNGQRLAAQRSSLRLCERRFGEIARAYQSAVVEAATRPVQARECCQALVAGCVADVLIDGEAAIRLLSQAPGERSSAHPVNVMVISLLLGKALGMPAQELADLSLAALLHDVGKSQLPERLRAHDPAFSPGELEVYREHVGESTRLARRMGMPEGAILAIAQHHEMVDGTGFPTASTGEGMSLGGKVLALVNAYDNLCNPGRAGRTLTPHEALSLLFANQKARYDGAVLGAFIRMMGVYPPGSVVQLVNDRYALVVSVNPARPLKPRVIVHDPAVGRDDALILDLETVPDLGVRRSLKPTQLPRAAQDYLVPSRPVRYFYERQSHRTFAAAQA